MTLSKGQLIYIQGLIVNDVRRDNVKAYFVRYIPNTNYALIDVEGTYLKVDLIKITLDYMKK